MTHAINFFKNMCILNLLVQCILDFETYNLFVLTENVRILDQIM